MIGIIEYGSGNTRSLTNALTRLKQDYVLSRDPDMLAGCDKILFPGVGAAGAAMGALTDSGLVDWIKSCTKPFLGICLGFQILFESSEENNTDCLGILPGRVRAFRPTKIVPHMGWNRIEAEDLPAFHGSFFYFVHGFYVPVCEGMLANCTYEDETFSAIARNDNFWGVQFHPEKSGKTGEFFLDFFIANA